MRWLVLCAVPFAAMACTRKYYREQADKEVYGIIAERQESPLWDVPDRPVEAQAASRIAPIADQDKGPVPPDDPAAHSYMHKSYKFHGYKGWHKRGDLPFTEPPDWLENLPRKEGAVELSKPLSIQLGLQNSREYQTQVEQIYLSALGLSLERFAFDTQYAAGSSLFYDHFGNSSEPFESNTLTLDNGFGFQRAFAGGGQLVVDFANTFLWEFTGTDFNNASSGILVSMTQPLLRGAFRNVRLEQLTAAERDVLYQVRAFARFRRLFYVSVVGGSNGYLSLLSQLQGIRNQEANLASLARNLYLHQELEKGDAVSRIQVDQVFQQYQQGRLSLITAENSLQTSLDAYKILLGLPPQLVVRLDDSMLGMFELSVPVLDEMTSRNEQLRLALPLPGDPPQPRAAIQSTLEQLLEEQKRLAGIFEQVQNELGQWRDKIAKLRPRADSASEEYGIEQQSDREFQQELAAELDEVLFESRRALQADIDKTADLLANLGTQDPEKLGEAVRELVSGHFRERLSDCFVIQTRIRVFLIELTPVPFELEQAIEIALANRLDLMNQKARTVDAYRRTEVAADGLQSDLALRFEADLRTDSDKDNPIRFDASSNRYRVGVEFDSPLTRRQERNFYRRRQIEFQQARRAYMLAEDGVRAQIRSNIRDLETNRLRFEITRRQLLVAVRQVELAQIAVQESQEQDSNVTQNLLDALNSLLGAKNNLISNWVSYETTRLNLFRDLELMQIDEQGEWTNESDEWDAYCTWEIPVIEVEPVVDAKPEP